MYEFAKETSFEEKALGNKSTSDKTLFKLLLSADSQTNNNTPRDESVNSLIFSSLDQNLEVMKKMITPDNHMVSV